MLLSDQEQFDRAVWAVIAKIPRGKVSTYGDIAVAAGYPGYARHVGKSVQRIPEGRRPPLPWFRVVNAQGGISPRADQRSELEQRQRLQAEGVPFTAQGRIHLRVCRWRAGE